MHAANPDNRQRLHAALAQSENEAATAAALTVALPLGSIDELYLTPALMQLLALPDIKIRPLLIFNTAASARLAGRLLNDLAGVIRISTADTDEPPAGATLLLPSGSELDYGFPERIAAFLSSDKQFDELGLANGAGVARLWHAGGGVPVSAEPAAPSENPRAKVTCYINRGGAGNSVIRAFAEGLGAPLRYAEDELEARPGTPIVWGVLRNSDNVVRWADANGDDWYYVDHAYFERGHGRNYRITRKRYEAGPVRTWPDDRLQKLEIAPKPWNREGDVVLVCPPTEYFMAAHDCPDWLETTMAQLEKTTDRPILIRTKPQPGQRSEPLESVLKRTHALVTHSSNVAIEAVIEGTPVFVAPSSAAASVGLTDLALIDTPIYPDRDAWLAHLAYSQFSIDEIRDGSAWRLLMETETRELTR